jgi:hypothetical protein
MYKIKGIGLDTTTLDYVADVGDYDYLHTSISANNGLIIRGILEESIATIITSIDFLDQADKAIINHLYELGRDRIDLLLINSTCDFEKYSEQIKDLLDSSLVDQIGLKNPNNPEEIKRIMKIMPKLKYISLELCPLNFNYEIVKFCEDNDIDILVFNPYGGYISAPVLIDSFTMPYLLNFAAYYGTIVFLSGRELSSNAQKRYLEPLIDAEVENESIYQLNKTVKKLVKPLKKMVNTSIVINEEITLPFQALQSSLFSGDDLILSLDKTYYKVNKNDDLDDVEKYITEYLSKKEEYKLPEDTGNDSNSLSVLRYYISKWLDEILDRNNTVINCVKLSNNIFVYLVYEEEKKRRNTNYNPVGCYLLYKSEGNIQFLKVKNALPKP